MQKIILAVNALQLNTKCIDFAAYVAGVTCSKLTGVFLQNVVYESSPALKTPFALPYVESITSADEESPAQSKQIEENVSLFKHACIKRDIPCTVLVNKGKAIDEILAESRFADLIIVDAETSFSDGASEGTPTRFVKTLLENAECPVFITPAYFDEIEDIIFAYSGDRSSVYAIKQFTYIFPQLSSKRACLLYVAEDANENLKNAALITNWFNAHYSDFDCEILHGEAQYELFAKLIAKKNAILVMGAYGRNPLSQFFKHSTSELILKITNLPIFIAHR